MTNIADIRKEYKLQTLEEKNVDPNAIKQFDLWWNQAIKSNIEEVNAMTLATVAQNGKPSARIVLLKEYSEKGFVFFTNYQSHKGNDIDNNPNVSIVFFWKELERQIRIDGVAEKINENESDDYFNSRPDGSKIGAWASPQSKVIADRKTIEKNAMEYELKFAGTTIPRPSHWGGYIVKPEMIEFWQGRPGRLHDRIRYSLQHNNSWVKERLAP